MKVTTTKFEVFTALLFRWLVGYLPEHRNTESRQWYLQCLVVSLHALYCKQWYVKKSLKTLFYSTDIRFLPFLSHYINNSPTSVKTRRMYWQSNCYNHVHFRYIFLITTFVTLQIVGRNSVSLRAGRSGNRIPVRTRFSVRSDRPRGLPSLLQIGTVFLTQHKAAEAWC
jgi:hypothetical protein